MAPVRQSLADLAPYLERIRHLGLTESELRLIPARSVPPSGQGFVGLGYLPPGAPPLDSVPFIGTHPIYVWRSDVPDPLWHRLVAALTPRRASGRGGTGMFGHPGERVVDSDDPRHSWRILDAGEEYHPGL
ncbi:MAG: hypothetical protein IRY83_10710 [Chloroflexi bacterium]|nr:hypothetical protein [Chloroflexota bacterium]